MTRRQIDKETKNRNMQRTLEKALDVLAEATDLAIKERAAWAVYKYSGALYRAKVIPHWEMETVRAFADAALED